jgi:hypothetical protein
MVARQRKATGTGTGRAGHHSPDNTSTPLLRRTASRSRLTLLTIRYDSRVLCCVGFLSLLVDRASRLAQPVHPFRWSSPSVVR